MCDRQGKLEIGYPVMSVSEWTRNAPLVSAQVPKEWKIAQMEKRSVVDALVINANGEEESRQLYLNEQQKETAHQGAIVSPSVVPSESSIRRGVGIGEEKESVGIGEDKENENNKENKENANNEEKEIVIIMKEDNANKEKKEKENNKEEKTKTKTSLKSRLKGNVLFRFK